MVFWQKSAIFKIFLFKIFVVFVSGNTLNAFVCLWEHILKLIGLGEYDNLWIKLPLIFTMYCI